MKEIKSSAILIIRRLFIIIFKGKSIRALNSSSMLDSNHHHGLISEGGGICFDVGGEVVWYFGDERNHYRLR